MGMASITAETGGAEWTREKQETNGILNLWAKLCLHSGLPLDCHVT